MKLPEIQTNPVVVRSIVDRGVDITREVVPSA